MTKKTLISPEDQNVTFVELFFDLVFVFAITQITSLLHTHLDKTHVLQAIIIFWLIWWAWTQFTWTLNTIDTTNPLIEFVTLLSTAIAFFMAIAIPEAFGDRSILFATAYTITRIIGLSLQLKVAADLGQQEIVKTWVLRSFVGLGLVVIGSILGGDLQYILWILAILTDLSAANSGGGGDWTLNAGHIAERHGLIVIVALGESLIVAAGGLVHQPLNSELIIAGILSVSLTCILWWSYFIKPKAILEVAIEEATGPERGTIVRDVYSLAHFPMIAGIIAYALAIEEVISHPGKQLEIEFAIALALGIVLFVGGTVLAVWRATKDLMIPRVIFTLIAGILIATRILPISGMLIGLVLITTIQVLEYPQVSDNELEEVEIS